MATRATARADGRIPFRIRVGVIGHRELQGEAALAEAIRGQIRRISDLEPASPSTDVRLTVVSQLAEGADRLVVYAVLDEERARGREARLEALLPMPRGEYSRRQDFSPASREEFERLLERAAMITEPGSAESWAVDSIDRAYEVSGAELVHRCDVLLALWDGTPTRGKGGTAEMLLRAAARGKPCIWIRTEGEPTVEDNLLPRSSAAFYREVERRARVPEARAPTPLELGEPALRPLHEAFKALDEFNRERLPHDFDQRSRSSETPSPAASQWIAAPFSRATALAERYQRRFRWSAWYLSGLATAVAVTLAISVSFDAPRWTWAEFGVLVLLFAGYIVTRRLDFHGRWLSYRFLAERLRSAYFLAAAGVDLRATAGTDAVHVHPRPVDWILRTVEEVWDGRPQAETPGSALSESRLRELKLMLAREWIGGQMSYHERAARRHNRRALVLISTVFLLFVSTIPVAVLHALGIAESTMTFLAITLPAAAASLGVLLTLSQDRALAERSARMHSNLAVIQPALLDADARTLGRTSAEAARIIAEESGDWLGALWFLNIEHPP